MKRLQALADALTSCTGFHDPESETYQCRNPLALKAFSLKHKRNDSGLRIFDSLDDGYKAALYDLHVKCSGKSRAKVKEDSPLKLLIRCLSMPHSDTERVTIFLRKALQDQSINSETPLSYFTCQTQAEQ